MNESVGAGSCSRVAVLSSRDWGVPTVLFSAGMVTETRTRIAISLSGFVA
jgi:hypothetical protein